MLNTCASKFVKFLEDKGLHFDAKTTESGRSVVSFPYDGKIARIFFSGEDGTYMSMYLVFESVPAEKTPDMLVVCNELNNTYKWVKFYLDNDNDMVLQDDAILSVDNAADEVFELMLRMFDIGKEAKPKIMKAIYA
ncbi:MAG: YbjN domain-containing protein [Oscillospiraceae bacterium]|nr:YbjN domain-containing protein [Oscillospiraceae bacterium]